MGGFLQQAKDVKEVDHPFTHFARSWFTVFYSNVDAARVKQLYGGVSLYKGLTFISE
jgi:ATP-dependent Zn protease